MAPSVDLTAHSPPAPARIPKLKYRNPLPADQTSLSSRDSQDTGNSSTYVQDRSTTPDTHPASTISRPSYETAHLTSPSLASISSSADSSHDSRSSTKKKKKASSVLGFLSLKEPSQVALEQFAEAQRKQTAGKGTSSPLSKHSTYAGQKLPPNVPKVNSKWDGVPDSVKSLNKRHSTSTASSNGKRGSWSSHGSFDSRQGNQAIPWNDSRFSVMSNETRNPPNSVASAATSTSDFTIHKNNSSHGSSPSTTTLPEISYYFPEGPVASGALPAKSLTSQAMDEPTPRLSESTFHGRSSMDDSANARAASPASSTDSVDTVVRDAADNIFRKLNDQPQQNFWGESSPAVQSPDEDYVPESHDFLFSEQTVVERPKNDSPMSSPAVQHYAPPCPVQNFSRPTALRKSAPPTMPFTRRSSYRTTPSSSALPTLYEASLASSAESLATVQNDSDARSIAPSTIAPSELSRHWYESPRERLGLGGRLRMSNDVSPWDVGGPLSKPKKNRLSLFGLGTSRA
jgi:hypothetical protein